MLRILASIAIAALLVLDLLLPQTSLGRRGREAAARNDVPGAFAVLGERLPDFEVEEIGGGPIRLRDLEGRRVLLTFERSVDW
ncbi:MAG: hypothetical protein ABFS46_15940 [Myxococcota bacterium]